MRASNKNKFVTLKTEGELLPVDLLQRISSFDKTLEGLSLESYHLNPNERINEAASRSWNRIVAAWQSFCKAQEQLPESEIGTTITRERWLLILFQELGYGRLNPSKAIESKGRTYPISHFWNNSPIHLVGYKVDIDKKAAGIAGAARTSPHSLVQEFLNSTDRCLWGFVSNGLRLRILRDNLSLTRQAYVEFDLEAMMEGQVYSDFVMLWLLCHQSRVEAEKPKDSWLERWVQTAKDQGTRALENLRIGVENAIKALGSGFLSHPQNGELRKNLRTGVLPVQDYYRQLLRLVYRLIFLFVAEDRDLLFSPEADNAKKEFYSKYYSASRLRSMAENMRGTKHCDLYHGLRIIMDKLGHNNGCEVLGLSVLGSFLWSEKAIPDLAQNNISNIDLLSAIRSLSFITERRMFRYIDYRNLGSEELGSVYESLLELQPILNTDVGSFELKTAGGHERKTTGSYYTPSELIHCLLDSALDPVIREVQKEENPEEALLSLKICDPACGSGHFLIAAAHRLARRLASVRTGDDEPSPEATRSGLRDVIGHCLYGVDINPMAVELCKVGLWMEALEPGKPLSFLDHKILCGNSLLGTTPKLMQDGIPDSVFTPITRDDKKYCQRFRKRNKEERQGQRYLFDAELKPWGIMEGLSTDIQLLEEIEDYTIEGVRKKEKKHDEFMKSSGYRFGKFLADVWCASFVWKKVESSEVPYPITEEVFRKIEENPDFAPEWMRDEVHRLAEQYQFFHWHIMFPDVFKVALDDEELDNQQAGWNGGFDVVLGNPPWEKIKLQEKEFFSSLAPEIATAANASERDRLIEEIKDTNPGLNTKYLNALRMSESQSHFIRNSGNFPLAGQGDINTYLIFAENFRKVVNVFGCCGIITPTGIATDYTSKEFFQSLINTKSLISLFDFINSKGIFPGVHRSYKLCLLTMTGERENIDNATFAFFLKSIDELKDNENSFSLSTEEFKLINPNTKTCPIFISKRDADIVKKVYKNCPVLINEEENTNSWEVDYLRMFDMTNDSHLFHTKEQLEVKGFHLDGNIFKNGEDAYLPLYEGKMIWIYNHRYNSVNYHGGLVQGRHDTVETNLEQLEEPNFFPLPRVWITKTEVQKRIGGVNKYLFGFRGIADSANERTAIFSLLPFTACGNSLPILLNKKGSKIVFLIANTSTFIFDYVMRNKAGGNNVNYYIVKQLPVIPPDAYPEAYKEFIPPRVLELTYTAYDLKPFTEDCGYAGEPFKWDEERRFLLRCELDAAYFHLYRIERNDVDYIMETFPIVKRRDEEKHGECRTKRVILEIFDEMTEAMRAGRAYKTRLVPPPADLSVSHNT